MLGAYYLSISSVDFVVSCSNSIIYSYRIGSTCQGSSIMETRNTNWYLLLLTYHFFVDGSGHWLKVLVCVIAVDTTTANWSTLILVILANLADSQVDLRNLCIESGHTLHGRHSCQVIYII